MNTHNSAAGAPTPSPSPSQLARAKTALSAAIARGRKRHPLSVETRPARPYDGPGATPGLELQPIVFRSDSTPQGAVPALILRPAPGASAAAPPPPPLSLHKRPRAAPSTTPAPASTQQQQQPQRRPAVVLLHASYSQKEALLPELARYAAAGYVACAPDQRYHGERAAAPMTLAASVSAPAVSAGEVPTALSSPPAAAAAAAAGQGGSDGDTKQAPLAPLAPAAPAGGKGAAYQSAVVAAWRGQTDERPFLLDMAWDAIHLLDVLESLPDVDAARVGVGGISLGGMVAWLTAAADARVTAAAPAIGVQGWGYALRNDAWQARLASIPSLGPAAAGDLGKGAPDAEVAEAVLRQLLPGLLDDYDAPLSLPLIAPRPLLALNGEHDPRCPLPGVKAAFESAARAYEGAEAPRGALELRVFKGVGHEFTPAMSDAMHSFFAEWL